MIENCFNRWCKALLFVVREESLDEGTMGRNIEKELWEMGEGETQVDDRGAWVKWAFVEFCLLVL